MKNSQSRNRASRKPLLSSIGLAVVATLIASGAHAADTSFGVSPGTEVVNGGQGLALLQQNTAPVSAEVMNSQTYQTSADAGNPASGGNSNLLDSNTVGARAIGNDFDNSIGLALINSDSSAGEQTGSAILGRSINSGDISTLVSGNSLSILDAINSDAPNSRTLTNNTVSADSFGNRGVSLIAGPVPNIFTSAIDGSSAMSSSGFAAAGGIVVTSAQETTGAALASAESNTITLGLTSTDVNAENSSGVLTGNMISATARGNRAASAISIESGGAPSFAGSAVVSNLQSGNGANATADNLDSTINALVKSTDGGINTLQGALAVSSNTISSVATGNDALGSTAAAGNRILLADGMSFAGAGTAAPGSTLASDNSGSSTADLVIHNLQNMSGSAIASTTKNGQVLAAIKAIESGSIDLSGNRISASATGNAAASVLDNGANVASFVGSVALASQQVNADVGITAINSNALTAADIGNNTVSTVSIARNSSTAAGRGNQSSQSLVLNANTLPLSGTTAAVLTGTDSGVVALGAATVSNLQSSTAAPVSALLTASTNYTTAIDASGSTLTIGGGRKDDNGNFIDANTQEAQALGNSASNEMALIGTTVGAGAGVVSVQQGSAASSVTALVEDADSSLTAFGFTRSSTLSISNNAVRAISYGNSARNVLSMATNNFAAGSPAASLSGNVSTGVLATGASVVGNMQTQAAEVEARIISSAYQLPAFVVTDGSTLVIDGNSQEAMARRNNASNTLSIMGNSVGRGAGIVSVQRGDSGSAVTAGVEDASASLFAEAVYERSSLSVSNNAQRAMGYGNSVSNALSIEANDFAGSAASLSASPIKVMASGAATLSNLQAQNASVDADNLSSTIQVKVNDSIYGGSLAVADNTQEAMALGNSASNALALEGTTLGAGVGLVSAQYNNTAPVTALLSNAQTRLYSDNDIRASTATVSNNAQRAMGYGNSASNALTVAGNDFAAGSIAADLSVVDSSVAATGAATLSNLQQQTGASVLADNTNSFTGLAVYSDIDERSTVTVAGNTQEAMALGSSARNALTLTGTTVGAGAGLVNAQRGDADSTVTATLSNAQVAVNVINNDIEDSTVSVTNNLQRAIGYGNSATNALSVAANAISVDRTTTTPSVVSTTDSDAALSVLASYGVLNAQSVLSDVSATATSVKGLGASKINVGDLGDLGDNVERSTLRNEGNALVAAAYGNESKSSIDLLGASSINAGAAETGFAPVANITSTQAVNATISATANGQAAASTAIGGQLLDSTVSTSGNSVNAQAIGNLAENLFGSLDSNNNLVLAKAGNISTVVDAVTGTSADSADLRTNASFSVQNVQSGLGSVMATHQDNALSTEVRVDVGNTVTNSSVLADRNSATASATSNSAFNTLGLEAGSLASSSAVQNVQTTSADMTALMGSAATAGTLAQAFTGTGTGPTSGTVGVTDGGGVTTLNLGTNSGATINFASVTDSAELAALTKLLTDAGFSVNGTTATATTTTDGRSYNVSFFDLFNYSNSTVTFTGFSSASAPGTAARGGVMLAVGADVIDSTLSVAGNVTNGSAVGNRAVNTSVLKGNDVVTGSNLLSAVVKQGDSIASASADHTLSNLQTAVDDAISSTVGGFAIDAQPGVDISGATLRVSGNSQTATARGNTATNALSLDGNSLTALLALQSTQVGSTAVDARSTLDMYAPADVTNSSVTISDNVNTARAVVNNASNSLLVSGTNVGSSQAGSINVVPASTVDNVLTPEVTSISAEQVLANHQTATGAVISTAVTTLYNQGQYTNGAASLVDSTLNLTGNTTQAVALANQALNIATVSSGKQAASVALSNSQDSIEAVTAMATTTTNVVLRGDVNGAVALNNSSVLLGGNNTTALAAGNYADNALNSLASNAYGAASGGTTSLLQAGLSVNANAGILNRQSNGGAVEALSKDATYQVALNSGVSNSSVSLAGNRVAAEAYGNSATNRMTLNALNTGASTAAVANYQRNDGSITAVVTGVTYGVGITGATAVLGSTVRTTGNQITATAVGNSAVSSILAAVR